MSEHVKIVAIGRGAEPPRQFALAVGEVISLGRAADSDVQVELRGISACHAELSLAPVANSAEGAMQLRIKDCSTNGTGVTNLQGDCPQESWAPLRKGESRVLSSTSQLLVPLNRKAKELSIVLTVRVIGDCLPDAYDDRHFSGRWRYHSKLGEGALGIVYRATDASGRLTEDVAVKVSKIQQSAKNGAKLRHAYILHREAQWSLQRLHNVRSRHFKAQRASLFAQYLEDHTGRWAAPELDFEAERTVFEAADFGWDRFRPSPPAPPCPYVVMELVPGRTLHSCMGWGHEKPLSPGLDCQEKKLIAKQLAEALEYLEAFDLIHRDFRTTNLLLVGRGAAGHIKVIDLGHTIAAEPEQVKNRSAVVRCSWRESKQKRFDWAPLEVKSETEHVNFVFPVHAFDVFSLAILLLQLHTSSLQASRTAAMRLAAGGSADAAQSQQASNDGIHGSTLGLDEDFLKRLLGPAVSRPHPSDIVTAFEQMLRPKQNLELRRAAHHLHHHNHHHHRDRSRSRDCLRGQDGRNSPLKPMQEVEIEVVDDGYDVWSDVAYSSPTEPSGSDTEPL